MKKGFLSILIWGLISIAGGIAFGLVALNRGETISAVWLVIAAISCYAVAYRFYSRFMARKVFSLNDNRRTPAEVKNDGKDYVPTNKWVLFGHHFAAIAGAGPLVGPVLAAQMGYVPGTLWIIVGVILGGAVQDFVVLFASMRRGGKSLGDMIKDEIGPVTGTIAMIGILGIMIILLAVLGLVVVKALIGSPWGMFTIAATIPIALFMGVYMRYIRPGRVLEASLIGFVLLLLSLIGGQYVAEHPTLGAMFTFTGTQIAIMMIIYGFIASVMPVWLLLAPRDYLSTFLKIGTIVGLAIGIVFVMPDLNMPATTKFIDGTGPVFSGNLFPFLFITIACGAVSGFHALISSGTTPKMLERESHARPIGYGAMLMESFVAIMALIAACVITPGTYFAINSPAAVIGSDAVQAASTISSWGFTISPDDLTQISKDVGEASILSKTGGAPTFAIGMAHILSNVVGGKTLMSFWYHFAILFEALFILTTIDAGTRVGRFLIQDLLKYAYNHLGNTESLTGNIVATTLCVAGWGYFLYQGVVDPLGGINSLWALFGIANQMLAGIALVLGTTILFKMGKKKYIWVTLIPTAWILLVTMSAGYQKIFHPDPAIGFLAHANKFNSALNSGSLLAPAKTTDQMKQIIMNDNVNAILCGFFMLVVILVFLSALRIWIQSSKNRPLPLHESPYISRDSEEATKFV
ncbi:Carbon starvation protein A [Paenibacillus larvae subsp. larvae]|uniref:Carbon starvation protein A n=1 Tax=Paenibacillus larvae subsp. larvae TaxID=147375 RepID=A0A2L1U8Y0_9BACL|nr:carbon starvation CstA family protein [Paenibacillus larvae]AQT85292.1 carbon starvation protein A [Paenibacillus larvae subsp. pulvifaciens]AQZ47296.1 carbon starvation protein A [Paenibacillus larvae subsp. pulvifaciens]AVF24600.1 Carbon starvation protein A [Paenibacillus larvae subsp. larvae]AVF29361.1 Carbon starvation protein A [Paenibacillus larvae subsp. larvae]MBH0343194.1 carbon starvation protein A [Paenibacillus larvae]